MGSRDKAGTSSDGDGEGCSLEGEAFEEVPEEQPFDGEVCRPFDVGDVAPFMRDFRCDRIT